jgi:hypothetical protein
MRLFLCGVFVGAVIATALSAFAAMPAGRVDREFSKFVEDVNGKSALRIVLSY